MPEDFLLPSVDDDDYDVTGRKTDWDSSNDWSVNQEKEYGTSWLVSQPWGRESGLVSQPRRKKMAHRDWSVRFPLHFVRDSQELITWSRFGHYLHWETSTFFHISHLKCFFVVLFHRGVFSVLWIRRIFMRIPICKEYFA